MIRQLGKAAQSGIPILNDMVPGSPLPHDASTIGSDGLELDDDVGPDSVFRNEIRTPSGQPRFHRGSLLP